MTNILQIVEKEEIERLSQEKNIPNFKVGDQVSVKVKISLISGERYQNYSGVVIARKNKGVSSSFTVLRVVNNYVVERFFPLYSPVIASISILRCGKVRRAKLYYLRSLRGKAARIKEDLKRKRNIIKDKI